MGENLVEQYYIKFGELPPLDAVISYNDKIYSEMIEKAIKEEKPITPEMMEKKFSNYAYDLVSNKEQQPNESEDNDMQEEKIRNLLKKYGAADSEIENFMNDLMEVKEDIDDFNYLDADTMGKLKSSDEGKRLIMNAPKMQREELKKAVTELLNK